MNAELEMDVKMEVMKVQRPTSMLNVKLYKVKF